MWISLLKNWLLFTPTIGHNDCRCSCLTSFWYNACSPFIISSNSKRMTNEDTITMELLRLDRPNCPTNLVTVIHELSLIGILKFYINRLMLWSVPRLLSKFDLKVANKYIRAKSNPSKPKTNWNLIPVFVNLLRREK